MTDSSNLGLSQSQSEKIGDRFRNARLLKGKTLAEMASVVKVREHYLAAMEEGRFGDLPPGLNGRGLVRVYARELKVVLEEFSAQTASQSDAHSNANVDLTGGNKSTLQAQSGKDNEPGYNEFTIDRITSTLPKEPIKISGSSGRSSTSNVSPLQNIREGKKQGQNVSPQVTHRTPERIPQNVSKFTLPNDSDDESNLDILTPDVASILGLGQFEKPSDLNAGISEFPSNLETLEPSTDASVPVETPTPIVEPVKIVTHLASIEQSQPPEEFSAPKSNQFQPVVHHAVDDREMANKEFNKKAILIGAMVVVAVALIGIAIKMFGSGGSEKVIVREIETPAQENTSAPETDVKLESVEKIEGAETKPSELQEAADGTLGAASASVLAASVDSTTAVASGSTTQEPATTAALSEATFVVLAEVPIQVNVDSEKGELKVMPAGTHKIQFTKTVELVIDDGSKVSLKYGNWDLGVLGMEGRKRKITLHSEDFSETPN
jgi:hypothetical protein